MDREEILIKSESGSDDDAIQHFWNADDDNDELESRGYHKFISHKRLHAEG